MSGSAFWVSGRPFSLFRSDFMCVRRSLRLVCEVFSEVARHGIGPKNIVFIRSFQKFPKVHETYGKRVRSVWECILGARASIFVLW